MSALLNHTIAALVYLALCFILFFVGRLVYKFLHRRINISHELVFKDNIAFALSQIGYYAGLIMALGGAIIGPSYGLKADVIDILVYGSLSILLLNLSLFINDKLILYKFSVYKEIIHDMNAGAGLIHGASAFSTGLIIFGAVFGEGGGIDTVLVFWLVSQILLIVTAFVYKSILSYDVHAQIEKDNVAAAIGFAGALIAIANLIRNAVMSDFVSWSNSFIEIGVCVGLGLLLLPIMRFLTNKVLLPGRKLTDEIVNQEKPNLGAAFFEAFGYIVSSVLLAWCF